MSRFYIVEPEVAGGFGDNIEIVRNPGRPMEVVKLHYVFDGWLGDCIVESTPCYLVTKELENSIMVANMAGVTFHDAEISTSLEFEEVMGGVTVPPFRWMKVKGAAGVDDFGVSRELALVVSDQALSLLQNCGIAHASVSPSLS